MLKHMPGLGLQEKEFPTERKWPTARLLQGGIRNKG